MTTSFRDMKRHAAPKDASKGPLDSQRIAGLHDKLRNDRASQRRDTQNRTRFAKVVCSQMICLED